MHTLTMKHKTYEFSLTTSLTGIDTDEKIINVSNALFEAGCDDGSPSFYGDALYISFYREAESYEQAVISAIKDAEKVEGIKVLSVDAGDHVGLTDAAELSGVSKMALSRYSRGERGAGNFPCPVERLNGKTPLWSWSEIATWLKENNKDQGKDQFYEEMVCNAEVTAAINIALQLRDKVKSDRVSTYLSLMA
ncbi:hypothetical protein L4174_024010 (plasmid) [Photobacterium sp. CCB-ST2H9]|uniref:helix-turn-helix transcriptional regulator n=1 Tax=Photobacterium sp. CCB-ST2H9 TaxID=2912855 RepID=UPI002003D766|nr:hypothetical protein [Photobacterium sp. CCB-ST2H9]UTM60452.1 hypothetical protein L4174_024010 [Photobacterium sp. CCB-ST2H9]